MNKDHTAGFLAWFAGGVALGATVALLLAPQSGDETRKALKDSAKEGRKSFLASAQEAVQRGRELFERGRELAEEAAEAIEKTRRITERKIEDRF